MSWFARCFGFNEAVYAEAQQKLLKCWDPVSGLLNGWHVGDFVFEDLATVRQRGKAVVCEKGLNGKPTFVHIIGEARELHSLQQNEGAMFQVASQFNCLEFISANCIPEDGITNYIYDATQGPACAVACGAGTAFRNYLVQHNNSVGQTANNQLNAMDEAFNHLNKEKVLVHCQNGYLDVVDCSSLLEINKLLSNSDTAKTITDKVKVGAQYSTQVTDLDKDRKFYVSQCFCAAPAISYSNCNLDNWYWESLSQVILNATYESSLWHTVLSHDYTSGKRPKLLLTKVGGGVFGNHPAWIRQAIEHMLQIASEHNIPVDVQLVHFGHVEESYKQVKLT